MRVYIVAGLAYGDEGKGTMVDYLCRYHGASLVVRYNGGPQAAHNVVLPDGRHHTFAQFGSGTFIPEVETYISEHMLIEPFAMLNEAEVLASKGVTDALNRVIVNPKSTIITPWHWMANRIRELNRGDQRHGSCGMGVGEARRDRLGGIFFEVFDLLRSGGRDILEVIKRCHLSECANLVNSDKARDLYKMMEAEDPNKLWRFYQVEWLPRVEIASYDIVNSFHKTVVFEGAQGVLLDETHGFGEYTTWTDCTFNNAYEILNHYGAGKSVDVTRIGVVRSYYTRHGPGPFVTEKEPAGLNGISDPTDINNPSNEWQGELRVGYFDIPALRYALRVIGGVDYLAITHLDLVDPKRWLYCDSYVSGLNSFGDISPKLMENWRSLGHTLRHAPDVKCIVEGLTGFKVGYQSHGKTHVHKLESEEVSAREEEWSRRTA